MKIKSIENNIITHFIKKDYSYEQMIQHLKVFPSELKNIILSSDKLKTHLRKQKLKKIINQKNV